MSSLEIALCGTPQVLRDGDPLPLPQSKKTRGLLAYLVMNPREHRRQQLTDILWDVADDPRGGLRWALSKLRSLLDEPGHQRIVADRETIRADIRDVTIDARDILAIDVDSASIGELEVLCGHFRGEFCEGVDLEDLYGFHAWCVGLRQDLKRRHALMRERLATLLWDRPEAALVHARVLCQLVPEDETAHALQVRLLAAMGQSTEAERYRRSSRAMLADRFGQRAFRALDRALEADGHDEAPPSMARAELEAGAEPPPQRIHFCRSADGTGIAYAEVGQGPTLVKTANWVSHLEHEFRSPVWRHLIRELSRGRRLVRYDQRGNGLSDRRVKEVSGDRQVEDLEAVMDAAGCESVSLLGISQGCPVAVQYAVRHPERVHKLVLYKEYASGWGTRGNKSIEWGTALATMARLGWGRSNPAFRQIWTSLFLPNAAAEAMDWFNEMQRIACAPDVAAELILALGDLDVRPLLSKVRCPTLVIHLEGDQAVRFEFGKELAQGIEGARFVPIAGENHIPLETDASFPKVIREIDAFLAE